jgi:hypothetical protein
MSTQQDSDLEQFSYPDQAVNPEHGSAEVTSDAAINSLPQPSGQIIGEDLAYHTSIESIGDRLDRARAMVDSALPNAPEIQQKQEKEPVVSIEECVRAGVWLESYRGKEVA